MERNKVSKGIIILLLIGVFCQSGGRADAFLTYVVNVADQRVDDLAANTVAVVGCNLANDSVAFQADHNGAGTQTHYLFSERMPAASYSGLTIRVYISTVQSVATLITACQTHDLSPNYMEEVRSDGVTWSLEAENQTTRIYSYGTPYDGDVTASTTVTFNYAIYFNCSTDFDNYDTTGVAIQDSTDSFNLVPVTTAINTCGVQNVSLTKTFLTEGHQFIWYPYISSSAGTSTTITGFPHLFWVVEQGEFLGTLHPDNATSSFFGFLNVPNLLRSKKPFSYLYEIADLISTNPTTTKTAGTFSYDFGEYASGTPLETIGEVELFGTSTVTFFLTPTILSLFRTLVVAVMYISFGFFAFHKIIHLV